jgi:uncharacterized membrane protein HdeD (DUF308 family)
MSLQEGTIQTLSGQSDRTSRPRFAMEDPVRQLVSDAARYWWVEFAVGVVWLLIAAVVLKFDQASVVTVGVLTGLMFLLFAAENFALAAVDRSAGWLWAIFGVLMTAAGVFALIEPVKTFADFAEILGVVFMLIGVMWIVRALYERLVNELWWLTLTSGILMTIMAFWVSGQFFLERAYTLLVFAGIWALMAGITDIVRALQIRRLASDVGLQQRPHTARTHEEVASNG